MSIYIAHNRTVHALTMPNVHSSNVIHIAQLITVTFESRRRIQYCNPRPPVFVRQRPGLPGRRLSARRRRPCQTTAFCRHSNTRCQSDAQQFWRQDLCRRRTTSLEQSAAQSQTMWAVIRPVQTVTEDIFIRTVRSRRSVN